MTKPGPPGNNAPANYDDLTDGRLTNNSNITRMPTTQREWSTFVRELNKWIKNETGNFDVGGSATAQFTGFSADPADANIWWHRYGQLVHMQFHFATGTSDTTAFTITGVPKIITPRDTSIVLCHGLTDNSANVTHVGTVGVGSDSVLTFYSNAYLGNWTASGLKGFSVSGVSSIIYSLRSPEKL
jgi:hypothetical protein